MLDVHALLLVKNEVDVVGDVVRAASRWAAGIHVLDNGSDDGTWEELQRIAVDLPNVNLLGQDFSTYRDELRAEMFHRAKSRVHECDWWVKLDADEFHIMDPRALLKSVPRYSDSVLGSMYHYYFTDIDAETYESDPDAWLAQPLTSRIRWYQNNWAEMRAIRHSLTGKWTSGHWPGGTLRIASLELPIRHYQYRSPEQISRRLASRLQLPSFVHEHGRDFIEDLDRADWRQVIHSHRGLDFDNGDQPLIARYESGRSGKDFARSQVGWAARKLARVIRPAKGAARVTEQ